MTRAPVSRSLLQVFVVALAAVFVLLVYTIQRIAAQGQVDEARHADAIVVLGAAQYSGLPSGVFEARLQHAVDLWNQKLATWFIVTGGKLPGDVTTEAATAKAFAIAHGVPKEAILGEFQGRNTLESLQGVDEILRRNDLRTAIFVSDRTHMLRVLRMASDLGIKAFGSPTTTSPTDLEADRRWRSIAHELLGLAAYYAGVEQTFEDSATTSAP